MFRSILVCVILLAASTLHAASRPNVLFISVDDLNDWVSTLGGHPQSKTPNIDKLVARGVLFTDAHCAAPLCNPSRAALMTGIRPSTSGVYSNDQPWRASPVLKDAVTLPQHFMRNGYTALAAGKIYHGSFPDPPSWNEYWPSQTKNKPNDPTPPHKNQNGLKRGHFDWAPLDVDDSQMGDYQVVDWVSDVLTQRQFDKPFFLGCGLFRPHLPWYVPRTYYDAHPLKQVKLPVVLENDLADVPAAGVKMAKPQGDHAIVVQHDQWANGVQGYLASISFTDAQVGRLMEAFDASGHADDTIIVLWSDHGWHLGEKEHWRKFTLWERATRVVFAIIAPGVTKPGTRCDRPVNLVDIYPTLIDLCGLPPRPELEGVSLRPLLMNPQAAWDRPSVTTFGRNNHAARDERWRYIRYADGSEELYDHQSDPNEWTNLASQSQYDSIKHRLAQSMPTVNAEPSLTRKKKRGGNNDEE